MDEQDYIILNYRINLSTQKLYSFYNSSTIKIKQHTYILKVTKP